MQRLWMVLLFLILVLVACETAVPGTPTPFPTEAAVTPLPLTSSQPIALEIADLLATPEASQDALIQLTGQYYRRPKLICESDPHPSPATWELASGEAVAAAGGFDGELRRLLPDGLTMTVEGHWLLWRGPVGCGKRAEVKDIWYLQVSRIVSPSPITQVTLTPVIPGIAVAGGGIITSEITITSTQSVTVTLPTPLVPEQPPTATLTPEGQLPILTPTLELIEPTVPPELEETEVFTPTATITGEVTVPIGEATATLEPGAPTFTPAPGTPTNTPDPNATATFTPIPGSDVRVTIQEEIEAVSLSKNILGENEIHAWPFEVGVNEMVTVTAVTAANVTLLISIVDETGTALIDENASSGEVATIGQFELDLPDTYHIHVQTEDGSPAEYALMMLFSDSLNFIFQPVIAYGAAETINIPAASEHFWHFVGNGGDEITITAVPDSTTDVFLELYGPNADRVSAPFISVGEDGVTEQLEFTLPEDGLYSIRVGEWDFADGSYQLVLIEN